MEARDEESVALYEEQPFVYPAQLTRLATQARPQVAHLLQVLKGTRAEVTQGVRTVFRDPLEVVNLRVQLLESAQVESQVEVGDLISVAIPGLGVTTPRRFWVMETSYSYQVQQNSFHVDLVLLDDRVIQPLASTVASALGPGAGAECGRD